LIQVGWDADGEPRFSRVASRASAIAHTIPHYLETLPAMMAFGTAADAALLQFAQETRLKHAQHASQTCSEIASLAESIRSTLSAIPTQQSTPSDILADVSNLKLPHQFKLVDSLSKFNLAPPSSIDLIGSFSSPLLPHIPSLNSNSSATFDLCVTMPIKTLSNSDFKHFSKYIDKHNLYLFSLVSTLVHSNHFKSLNSASIVIHPLLPQISDLLLTATITINSYIELRLLLSPNPHSLTTQTLTQLHNNANSNQHQTIYIDIPQLTLQYQSRLILRQLETSKGTSFLRQSLVLLQSHNEFGLALYSIIRDFIPDLSGYIALFLVLSTLENYSNPNTTPFSQLLRKSLLQLSKLNSNNPLQWNAFHALCIPESDSIRWSYLAKCAIQSLDHVLTSSADYSHAIQTALAMLHRQHARVNIEQ